MYEKAMIMISDLDIWSMGKGKGAKSLAVTLNGYAENGWRVFFITGNRTPKAAADIHENIIITGFDLRIIKMLYSIRVIGFFAKFLWWIIFQFWSTLIALKIVLIDKNRIDLVYGYEILGAPAAKLQSLIFHVPMVSRFQGSVLFPMLDNPLGLIRHWQHVIAYKVKSPLIIMTNDGTQGDRVLERLNVNMDQVLFLMNGVDKGLCLDQTMSPDHRHIYPIEISNKKVIFTVSRLKEWKRVDRAIIAFSQVLRSVKDVILVIVGDGPERNTLEKLTRDLNVKDDVLFVGAVSRKEIGQYYRMGDIFLSLYDLSNVGNPLLEAMICGKSIIALNTGDTNTIIDNGVNGLLIDKDELDELPNVIVDLLQNPDLRYKLAENAKAYAFTHFKTWEERMQIEFSGVEQLLDGKH